MDRDAARDCYATLISNQASVMCPAGEVLRGIQNGAPICVSTSAGGGGACTAGEFRSVFHETGDSGWWSYEWVSFCP
jgi:hypothetical protein